MKHQLHIFPGFSIGGAQRRFAQLYAALPEWRHTIVPLNGDRAAASLCGDGDRLAFLDAEVAKSSGLSFANIKTLDQLIRHANPDVLCTYNWGSIEGAMANRLGPKRPHIHFEDGFGPDEAEHRNSKRNLMRALVLRGRTLTVVPSRVLERIASTEWKLPARRLRYIANGVDTERFCPASDNHSGEGPPVIGTVAALRAEKNIERLLRVADVAPAEAIVRIVGDGPERKTLEAEAGMLALHADFVGARSDTAPLYHGFDVFALTSDTEQMPLTVLEAMASGLPVVATDVGDVKEMVAPSNRPFILPPEDEEGLARALTTLLNDRNAARKIGAENRARAVEIFSETRMFEIYHDVFNGIASGRR